MLFLQPLGGAPGTAVIRRFFVWENRIVTPNPNLPNLHLPVAATANEIIIRRAVTSAERLAVFAFRYSVIVDELGVMIPTANHERRTVEDPEDSCGHLFAAFREGEVVGTARANFLREGSVKPHSELLDLDDAPTRGVTSVSSRFLVTARLRGSLVAVRIIQAWYRFIRSAGIEFDYILAKNDLLDLYTRIGYRPCGEPVHHPEIGDVLPLRLGVLDEAHFRAVRSPLVHCLAEFHGDAESLEFDRL